LLIIHDRCSKKKFDFARKLRKNATPAERVLWECIRRKALGYKFRRQHVVFGYIVDFWCPALRLAIEIDGKVHDPIKDAKRDKHLKQDGVDTVLRFTNEQVFDNLSGVIIEIKNHLKG